MWSSQHTAPNSYTDAYVDIRDDNGSSLLQSCSDTYGDLSNTLSSCCSHSINSSASATPSLALTTNSNSTVSDDETLKNEVSVLPLNDIEENDNGLDVLEDLCYHSTFIERDIANSSHLSNLNSSSSNDMTTNHIPINAKNSKSFENKDTYHSEKEQQREKVGLSL